MRLRLIAAAAAVGILIAPAASSAAPSVFGRWEVDSGSGVIQTARCGGALCGTIVGATHAPADVDRPTYCDRVILHATYDADSGRWDGVIENPTDGSRWNCEVWTEPDGLHLRGYVLTPLLGETQVWPPFTGTIGPACAIRPPG